MTRFLNAAVALRGLATLLSHLSPAPDINVQQQLFACRSNSFVIGLTECVRRQFLVALPYFLRGGSRTIAQASNFFGSKLTSVAVPFDCPCTIWMALK